MISIKTRILYLVILFMIFGCQTDDIVPTAIDGRLTTRFVNAEDIPSIINKVDQALNLRGGSPNSANNGQFNTSIGSIDLDKILEVIDTANSANYTFSIQDNDEDIRTFSNLVVKKRESGDIDTPFLMHYRVDSAHMKEFIDGGFSMDKFTGQLTKEYLINNNSNNGGNSANLNSNVRSSTNGNCSNTADFTNGDGIWWDQPVDGGDGTNDTGTGTNQDNPGGGHYEWFCETQTKKVGEDDCWRDSVIWPGSGMRWRDHACTPTDGVDIMVTVCEYKFVDGSSASGNECGSLESESVGILPAAFDEFLSSLTLNSAFGNVDAGIIPSWLWQQGYVNPYGAGIIDGLWEIIESGWGTYTFVNAWLTIVPSAEQMEIRRQTYQMAILLNELVTNASFREETWNALKTSMSDYIDETAALTPQAQYNQGKLIFDVATLFVGIGEIKALLKGESLILGIIKSLNRLPKALSTAIHNAKSLGHIVIKNGNEIIVKALNGTDEIAKIVNGVMDFNYSGFGGNIKTIANKTTTILGRYIDPFDGDGTKRILDSGLFKQGNNTGGFNLINDPNWTLNRNFDWLNEAIARDDIIRVISDPRKPSNITENGVKTIFGEEVQLLTEAGYVFKPSTFTFIR